MGGGGGAEEVRGRVAQKRKRQWCGKWQRNRRRIGQHPMGGRRGGNRKMVPPVVPLLRTLVRLCVYSINPIHEVAMRVFFNCMCKDDANNK